MVATLRQRVHGDGTGAGRIGRGKLLPAREQTRRLGNYGGNGGPVSGKPRRWKLEFTQLL